jgi:hypothetical protein
LLFELVLHDRFFRDLGGAARGATKLALELGLLQLREEDQHEAHKQHGKRDQPDDLVREHPTVSP